ncbi:hypothetical protein D3C85_1385030 [compost metagenome]
MVECAWSWTAGGAARTNPHSRRGVHRLRRTVLGLLRDGSGSRRWSSGQDGTRRHRRYPRLADQQIWVWSLSGWHFQSIQLRHRHKARAVADACPGKLRDFHDQLPALRRCRKGCRLGAPAEAVRDRPVPTVDRVDRYRHGACWCSPLGDQAWAWRSHC